MRKSIVMAVAAGALAFGGAASAQDLGTVLGSIFGIGTPAPGYNVDTPAVVASTPNVPYGTQVYVDQYGRQFYYDQYGQEVLVQAQPTAQYGITGYDAWGRPIYGPTSGNYAYTAPYGYSPYVRPDDDD